MAKNKDKIERLLDAYQKASAKRIAKTKKKEERFRAEEKAWELFDEELKKKIITVFRPVMEQLIARLDKKVFQIIARKLGSSSDTCECYYVHSRKEKHVYFSVELLETPDLPMGALSYSYATNEKNEKVFFEDYELEDIDEPLITKTFIRCLEKISK